MAMTVDGGRLIVADTANNRVLIWNNVASRTTGDPADIVLGQATFTSNAAGSGTNQMTRPVGVTVSGTKLLVADRGNSRMLVWDTVPTTSSLAPDQIHDLRSILKFSLPSWFDESTLTPGFLSSFEGRLYIGAFDRIVVIPDIF